MTEAAAPKRPGEPALTAPCCVVTGASSFIGAHLAARLARDGHRVLATISRPRAEYEGIRRERLDFAESSAAELAVLDLLDLDATVRFVRKHRPGAWFHHAGWTKGYGSFDYDPDVARRVNTRPLDALFPALKAVGCRGVIVTGSSAEYGEHDTPVAEDAACCPSMPYGWSKLEATVRARQLAVRYDLKARVARVFIPFGPMDAPGKVVCAAADALLHGQPIDLSPCIQRRDFLHVADLVDGYVRLLQSLDRAEDFLLYNLCSGLAVPVRRVLLLLCEALGADASLLRFGARPMRDSETMLCCGHSGKARRELGFVPRAIECAVARYAEEMRRP